MNGENTKSDSPDLSPRLQRIISVDDNQLPNSSLSELTDSEVNDLKKIVNRDIIPQGKYNIARAINALIVLEKSDEVSKILSNLVADEAEDSITRAVAATNLCFLPLEEAQQGLIENLMVNDPLVQQKVIKSLGQIGDRTALERLDEMPEPELEFVRKQFLFSKTLIAYRLGLTGDYLPFQEGADRTPGPGDELIDLSLRPISKKKIRDNLKLLEGSSYSIDISRNRGFELHAGKAKWALFLNKMLENNGFFSTFSKRRLITGLLARWNERSNTYAVQYLVLTNPREDSIDIMVVRTDGEIFYSGHANIKKDIMSFSISDIERPGTAPTKVRGKFDLQGVRFDLTVPFGKRKGQRTGSAINKADLRQ